MKIPNVLDISLEMVNLRLRVQTLAGFLLRSLLGLLGDSRRLLALRRCALVFVTCHGEWVTQKGKREREMLGLSLVEGRGEKERWRGSS